MAKYLVPPLTTVHIPMNFMGERAVEVLSERISTNRETSMCIAVSARLVIRESVSKVKQKTEIRIDRGR